jgi:hypothetical protein
MKPFRAWMSRRSQRGQNMVEYSMLNWVLAMGLLMATTVKVIPGPREQFEGGRMNILEAFLNAAQSYLDSVAFVINQPFP